jgi:hypothetical protein
MVQEIEEVTGAVIKITSERIHMPISWKLVVINCFLITVVEDFLLCVMAAFLAKRIRALAGDMFQN